jgi:UDP-N-acetyl-D-glucosamine dehydrogenase
MNRPLSTFEAVARKYETKQAVIGVIGLGYVGVPLALVSCAAGYEVIGFDIDGAKIERLNKGESYINHIASREIASRVEAGRFRATSEFAELASVDAILICVPTPLSRQREPDLRFVIDTSRVIARHLRPQQLVVLESTTYPGTTVEVVKPVLEVGGLVCGRDFYLAFSPEREDPGNQDYQTQSIPKVIGGENAQSLRLAVALYGRLFARVVPVSSSQTAEAVKLTENIFRAVNIALVNELKVIYDAMGIDIWEVIEAAKTKPFGFMPFYPGPGLGGHCIPIDPFYLTWKAREFDITTRFIELAGQINSNMPRWVLERLTLALDKKEGRGLHGARILLLGLAYKKNVDDMRESPSLKLIEMIEKRGGMVDYYDPFIPIVPVTREHAELAGRRSIMWDATRISGYDAVLIATDHDGVDYAGLARHAKIVVDTRNACARHGVRGANIVKA